MKTTSWSLAAAFIGPAAALPNNPWRAYAHKPGFAPKGHNGLIWHYPSAEVQNSTSWAAPSSTVASDVSSSSTSEAMISPSKSATGYTTVNVLPSFTTYTVVSTDINTVTECPFSVTDCLEHEKTTWTSQTTYSSSVITDTVYVTQVATVTEDTFITVTTESDSTVAIIETELALAATTCTERGWGAMTTFTFESDKTKATEFPTVSDTTRAIPTMPTLSSTWATAPSGAPSWVPSSWSGALSSASAPAATFTPSVYPGFEPACTRVPIPGCKPCEGQPGNDPDTYCGLDINTDYYETWPQTCMKVICKLTIDNVTISPDGVSRQAMVINGKFPGDLLEAWWGDVLEVTHTNNLAVNGSSLHFHGLRQLNTNEMDGVPSITQCPVPGQGGSITQTFIATQYGHTWIHSHYSLQTWEGVYAPMVIHGPTTWAFDYDLGPVLLGDWLHTPVFELFEEVERTGSPSQDNVLINGVGVYSPDASDTSIPWTGERARITLVPGKTHRLQLVCTALDSTFAVSLDNHIITVIGIDFVPIHPYTTKVLKIGIGQRYDIVIEANQAVDDYYLRVDALDFSVAPGQAPPCGASNAMANHTAAIVSYQHSPAFNQLALNPDTPGSELIVPTTTGWEHDTICEDEPADLLVPWLPKAVGPAGDSVSKDLVITQDTATNIYRWYLSGSTFQVSYSQPSLLQLYTNTSTFSGVDESKHDYTNLTGPLAIPVDTPGEWVYIIIETPVALSHPIHLHGHDVYILGAGNGTYTNQPLSVANPPRRDVATLPMAGWLVLGFIADNPGVWLMHCHIGWHVSMGFALQIVETPELARKDVTDSSLTENCEAWTAWDEGGNPVAVAVAEIDSGV